jgi:DNA-binding CsgD family transcriptional regulator
VRSLQLSAPDVRAILDAAAQCGTAPDRSTSEGTVQALLDALCALVPSDVVFWNSFTLPVPGGPRDDGQLVSAPRGRPAIRAPMDPWLEHLEEHPIMSGRYGPVASISDVISAREFRHTWLFQEAFRPAGLGHEIGLELSHRPDEMNVVVFSREPGRDYSDRDHLVLELLRPHVDRAMRRLSSPPPALTPRQEEVLRLVGEGLTDTQVARRLHLSERTVGKHLENIYARTGTHSRLQALTQTTN